MTFQTESSEKSSNVKFNEGESVTGLSIKFAKPVEGILLPTTYSVQTTRALVTSIMMILMVIIMKK